MAKKRYKEERLIREEPEALAEPEGFRPFPMGSSRTFEVPHPEVLSILPGSDGSYAEVYEVT